MNTLLPVPGYRNDLSVFIGELRDLLFKSQEEAAAYFYLNRSRISRYEDAKAKDKPKIGYLAELACLLTERNNNDPQTRQALLEEINKAARRDYRRGRFEAWTDLRQSAGVYMDKQRARRAKVSRPSESKWQNALKNRLDLPPRSALIGVEAYLERLLKVINAVNAPWLISIEGLGGQGKTALANALIRRPSLGSRFAGLAWVSAKQRDFFPGLDMEALTKPALDADTLIDALLEQLSGVLAVAQSSAQKKAALRQLLSQKPYLIVIDNLETVLDYQALLPTLQKLAAPGKIILTSRYSLRDYSHVFCLNLDELSRADAIRLIRQEAEIRGIDELLTAPEAQLEEIIEVVGGNPLALKLVSGQVSILPLSQALQNLKQGKGSSLYTYIYWQSWQLLSVPARQLLLIMPLAQNSAIDHLLFLSRLDASALDKAVKELMQLSLLQVRGNLKERRYAIHRLTETFLLNEAIQWKASL